MVSSQANDIAEQEAKKTIATEHVEKALRELGFPEYVGEVLAVAGEHKEQLKVSLPPLLWLVTGVFEEEEEGVPRSADVLGFIDARKAHE